MLYTVVFDITVKDILTFRPIVHKLMFKSEKPDVIRRIPESDKINVNSVETH